MMWQAVSQAVGSFLAALPLTIESWSTPRHIMKRFWNRGKPGLDNTESQGLPVDVLLAPCLLQAATTYTICNSS